MIKAAILTLSLLSADAASAELAWTKQSSGVSARLRGVSAVNDKLAWASGSANTVLRSTDGGATWTKLALPPEMSASPLDFRDIDAVDAKHVYLLSIGPGAASRIFKSSDAGATWTQQYINQDPQGFLDAMTFWDADNGLVVGDAIDGHLQILSTSNGGATWTKIPDTALPPALPNEGAFSASGSNIAMAGKDHAWIAMGSRVLHTPDHGKTWTVTSAPLASSPSAGIFSIAFRDSEHGVIVGGDYKAEGLAKDNLAITSDGGKTWQLVTSHGLSGFRSAVKYIPGTSSLIAVGPTGADQSLDDGKSWAPVAYPAPILGFDALSIAANGASAFASGAKGEVGQLKLK